MNLEIVLSFLKKLAKNNNRDWFETNREKYLEAKTSFQELVDKTLSEIVVFDNTLAGVNPKKLPFRIFRDVRFSEDKRPYKTNMGAGFSPNGKLEQEPGYYLHIEPGNKSFIAGGIYMPNSENLSKIRQEIDYNAEVLAAILKAKKFKSLFNGFDAFDALKTAPKGYAKDHPQIEWLKLKSLIVTKSFADKEVVDKKFIGKAVDGFKTMKPLNDFFRNALA